jgi:Xaa-Pro aminopeptidase
MRENRIEKVLNLLETTELDGCLLKGMDNIFYLTGFRGSEGTLLVTRGDVILMTDFRYITYAQEITEGIRVVEVRGKKSLLQEFCQQYHIRRLGFDSLHTPFSVYQKWCDEVEKVEFLPLSTGLEEIRKNKEPEEIDRIIEAIEVATRAFNEVFPRIRPGLTEKEIANDLDHAMRRLGADSPSFTTIVASGPRAALPHAEPTDKQINEGEMVIIDFGAQVNGYCSDETCTIVVGELNGKLKDIYGIVSDAKRFAMDKVRTGMPVKEIDMMVRGFIEEAGYGEQFRHGTGHGVGIAVHEAPAVTSSAEGLLEEGMVITIEPGIYVPHLGGVRLEDMLLITADYPRVLSRIRKDTLTVRA